MDRRIMIGGGIVAVAVVLLGVRLASNSGAKSGLDSALAHLPPGYTATHGAVTYSALTGEAQVRDFALFHNGAPVFAAGDVAVSGIGAQDATGTPRRIGEIVMHNASGGVYKHVGRVDLTGVYPATLREIFDKSAYPGGKPAWTDKRLVLEHGEAHDVEVAQTGVPGGKGGPVDVQFTMGTVVTEAVRLSQLPAPPDQGSPPMVILAEIEQSMSQDGSTMKDMTFAVGGALQVHAVVARGSSTKFDGGRIGELSLEGYTLSTTKPAGTVVMDKITVSDMDFSKMLGLLPIIAADPGNPHPEILNGFKIGRFSLEGLHIDYAGGPLVTMKSMVVGSQAGSAAGHFTMRALSIKTTDRPLSQSARTALEQFGMQDFVVDMDEEGTRDWPGGRATINSLDTKFHDLGTLHVALDVSGLPVTQITKVPQIQAAMLNARLESGSIAWEDNSLTARLFKMAEARQHSTPDQVRLGLSFPLASLAVLMPDQPDALAQVNAFLTGQHRLALTMKPPVAVSLAQWESTPVPQRAALLGAKISGN